MVDLTKRHLDDMIKDTGVIPSLQEEGIKEYSHEVLVELGKIKGKDLVVDKSNQGRYSTP